MDDFMVKRFFLFPILFFCCLWIIYEMGGKTYTAFESEVIGDASVEVATWNILINEKNLNEFIEQDLLVDNITWDTNHTREGKVSPGSVGVMKLVIDPSTTEVAIRYDITYEDREFSDEYLLHILSIAVDNDELIRTGENTYTGIFSLDDINNKKKKEILISLMWENDENQNVNDTMIGTGIKQPSYAKLHFRASQYQGEVIESYIE